MSRGRRGNRVEQPRCDEEINAVEDDGRPDERRLLIERLLLLQVDRAVRIDRRRQQHVYHETTEQLPLDPSVAHCAPTTRLNLTDNFIDVLRLIFAFIIVADDVVNVVVIRRGLVSLTSTELHFARQF